MKRTVLALSCRASSRRRSMPSRPAGPSGAVPSGQGVSNETGLPTEWSAAQNVIWKAEIPGRGHSSPIVWGDRIFLTTAFEGEVVPGTQGGEALRRGPGVRPPRRRRRRPQAHAEGAGARRRDRQAPLGADRLGGHALRHAPQEGQLRVADAGHRRRARLRLLRLGGPLRLRLRRQAGLEGVAGRHRRRWASASARRPCSTRTWSSSSATRTTARGRSSRRSTSRPARRSGACRGRCR